MVSRCHSNAVSTCEPLQRRWDSVLELKSVGFVQKRVGCSLFRSEGLLIACGLLGMYALRERRQHVTQEDFEFAIAKVRSSDEKLLRGQWTDRRGRIPGVETEPGRQYIGQQAVQLGALALLMCVLASWSVGQWGQWETGYHKCPLDLHNRRSIVDARNGDFILSCDALCLSCSPTPTSTTQPSEQDYRRGGGLNSILGAII
jgi:hypothetical protein